MSDLSPSASHDLFSVLRADGSLDPATDPHLPQEFVLRLYKHMVSVRILDERMVALQRQGRIGFHIGSLGEEAAIVGSAAATRPQDWIFPCYREFGAALWRGMALQTYINNMFGNAEDPVKGRQMPDHYTSRENHFVSIGSSVGTQITQAVGFALGAKIQKEELVTLVYLGDGATSTAEFHNGMNFAGVLQAPTVFLCRNNGWAISVPLQQQTASATIAIKGLAYGVPAVRVDGNDVFAVWKATSDAIQRAASGGGPTLLEAVTYRQGAHSTSDDPRAYRAEAEVVLWKERDPLLLLRRHLEREGVWTDALQRELEASCEREIKEAVVHAEQLPPPPLASLLEDVYQDMPWHLQEQYAALLAGPRPTAHL